MSENEEIEELDIPEEDFDDSYEDNINDNQVVEQQPNIQNNTGQSIISKIRERNNRNVQNNANNIRNAAEIASKSGNPYAMAAGKAVKTADRFSGGRFTEKLGKQLNTANKISPGGRKVQNNLNKASESGLGDKAASIFGRKKTNNTYQKKSSPKTVSGSTSKKGAVFATKNFKLKIILIAILVFVFIILFAAVAVSGGEKGKGKSNNSSAKNSYLYGSGTKEQLHTYLVDEGYCEDMETCESSDATIFYTKLKEKISTNRNLRSKETEAFITECIFYDRDPDVMFSTTNEIEYITSIIGTNEPFTLENADKYIDSFIADDGYLVTYRSDLVDTDSTQEERKQIFYDMLENANISHEIMSEQSNVLTRNYTCTQVTVVGENEGTYSLDEYVAMVVTAENDWVINGNLENNKAHAIAVRTKVIRDTDDCTLSVDNTKGQIKMSITASQNATAATNAVAGQILVDEENDYISISYDEFCLKNSDDNNYYLAQKDIAIPKTWASQNGINTSYLDSICSSSNKSGMSIWGSRYLSTQGKTYDQILSTFYEGSKITTIGQLSGGIVMSESGFAKRVSRALRDNPYIYSGLGLEGECAWYAVGRTNEILASVGKSARVTSGGNGGHFCDTTGYGWQYAQFPRVYDVNEFKPGMVISWSSDASIAGHSAGHVAIIEDVYYDSNGNVISVDISEAALSSGIGIGSTFTLPGHSDLYIATRDVIWDLPSGSYKTLVRQFACEGSLDGSTGNGCQLFVNVPANKIKNRWNGYTFNCAMDLLS